MLRVIAGAVLGVALLATTPSFAADAAKAPSASRAAMVTGPVTGGRHGWPLMASLADLKGAGYVEEEFFIEGSATIYGPAPGTTLGADGAWKVVATGSQPYKTRFLVRRPADPKRFNGTIIVEWFQPSAGFDKDVNFFWKKDEILRGGFAWVGVSAQRESVNGAKPFRDMGPPDLVHWDPERYGTLFVPSEDASYDIYSQVGLAIGPERATSPVDPMGGLKVERLVGVGNTFASDRLFPFYDAVNPLTRAYHGFVIGWRHQPNGHALAEGVAMPDILKLRTDAGTPAMVLNSTSEAVPYAPARQPDGPTYRLWEIAGGSHTNGYWAPQMTAVMHRDFKQPITTCRQPNEVPNQYVFNAAIRHMHLWLKDGKAPPSFPPIEIAGTPPKVQLDEYGNPKGGIRLPHLTVPVAKYETGGEPDCAGGGGFTRPFPAETLARLYPTREAYVAKFTAAMNEAVKAGFVLPPDAEKGIALAKAAKVPH